MNFNVRSKEPRTSKLSLMNNRIYDQTEFTKLLSIISPRGMNNNDQGLPDARYE